MGVKRRLLDHFANPAFADTLGVGNLLLPPDSRLCFSLREFAGDWKALSDIVVAMSDASVYWVPDANIAILPDSEPVWTSFRLAGMRQRDSAAVLVAPVFQELEQWIDDPYRNKSRARALREGLQSSNTWVSCFCLDPREDAELFRSFYSYIRLLGLRRALGLPSEAIATCLGAKSLSKSDMLNAVKDRVGLRAQRLAQKGRKDVESGGQININDESLLAHAIALSLVSGVETVVVTSDYDLVEIFYKFQWFIDTHYRAWLAAKQLFAAGAKPVACKAGLTNWFDGPVALYEKQSTSLSEVLPFHYEPVAVHVVYTDSRGDGLWCSFIFEREMLGMLRMRGRTGGRCTDLFGVANLHVDLVPLGGDLSRYVGVAEDRRMELDEVMMYLSPLDATHAVSCMERFEAQ